MHGGCLVVWADELAAVAPEGITGEFDVGREGISTVFDGVVGGAATGIDLGAPGRQVSAHEQGLLQRSFFKILHVAALRVCCSDWLSVLIAQLQH